MGLFRKRQEETEHSYVQERLSSYLDGKLSPRERLDVDRHLATCQRCRWELQTLRQTMQLLRELPAVAVPRSFAIPVPARPVRAARRAWTLPVLQGATALVALLFVFAVAGDLVLTRFLPAQAHQPALEREMAVAAPTEVAVAEAPQEVVVEVTKQVEQAVAAATAAPEPGAGATSEPLEAQKAVAEKAAAPTEEPVVGALGAPSPGSASENAATARIAVAATAPPPAAPTEALAVATAEEAAPATMVSEPTATPQPAEPTWTTAPTLVAAAEGPHEPVAEAPDQRLTLRERVQPWLGPLQFVLGLAFILLAALTIVAMLRRVRQS